MAEAEAPIPLPLSVCVLTRGASPRVAALLELLRPLASEIVVALDDRGADAADRLAAVTDQVLLFAHREPSDAHIPWLHAQCRQRWILNLDDDEVPSVALLDELPRLLEDGDVTHWWLPRRWLVGHVATYLDEPPWVPDYQLRLYRNDPRTLRFSDEFHRPVVVTGPAGFARAPLWHLDCVLTAPALRLEKALRYERSRRGMRVAGVAHNTGFYLPELRPDARRAAVPTADAALIRAVLEGSGEATGRRGAVRRAAPDEVDAHWPGALSASEGWHARIDPLHDLPRLTCDAEHTVTIELVNLSPVTWPHGSDASPLIQVATRWVDADGEPSPGMHTPLPSDLAAGASLLMPVHVRAPARPGSYRLVIDVVHEHVRWFEDEVELHVEIERGSRVGIVGRGEALAEALDGLQLQPRTEAVILERSRLVASDRYGPPRAPGLADYLFDGLEGRMTPGRVARLAARTMRLSRRVRRLRAGAAAAPLPRGAEEALAELARCDRVLVQSKDWEPHAAQTRELWRLATTVAVARRLGVAVDLANGALDDVAPGIDRQLARWIVRAANRP